MTAANSKWKYEKLAVVDRVPQAAQNLVISCSSLQRTAKKCTKIYNARALLLFCSLNRFFVDVLVAVGVGVCFSSLIRSHLDCATHVFWLEKPGHLFDQAVSHILLEKQWQQPFLTVAT